MKTKKQSKKQAYATLVKEANRDRRRNATDLTLRNNRARKNEIDVIWDELFSLRGDIAKIRGSVMLLMELGGNRAKKKS